MHPIWYVNPYGFLTHSVPWFPCLLHEAVISGSQNSFRYIWNNIHTVCVFQQQYTMRDTLWKIWSWDLHPRSCSLICKKLNVGKTPYLTTCLLLYNMGIKTCPSQGKVAQNFCGPPGHQCHAFLVSGLHTNSSSSLCDLLVPWVKSLILLSSVLTNQHGWMDDCRHQV